MNPMNDTMKKVGRRMSIYMGLAMSACLSIVGVLHGNLPNLMIGRVSVPQLIISIVTSFLISLVISLIIGFLIPIGKVTGAASKNLKPGPAKLALESLISDLIYTPVITLAMTVFAYTSVMRASGGKADLPAYPLMFLSSLVVCMIVGYILIFILTPILLRKAMKACGAEMPPQGPPSDTPKGK